MSLESQCCQAPVDLADDSNQNWTVYQCSQCGSKAPLSATDLIKLASNPASATPAPQHGD